MLAGFGIATVAFSLVYVMFGRSWLFFMPQVNLLLWFAQLPAASDNPWWVAPDWSWIKESTANAVMSAMFVISLVEAARIMLKREFSGRAIYMSIFVGYAVTYIVAVILQMRGLTTLHPDY